MLPEELLKKVKKIELSTKKVVNDMMSGRYRSHFKGHGMQFSDHRVYSAGDDIRHIDWKVTARSKEMVIKKYEEERELNVLLVVDVSGSGSFGSSEKLKSEVAAEIGGMLAMAATYTGDKVGTLMFAGGVEEIIPPKKGRQHVLRIVRSLLGFEPKTQGTDLAGALESANRIMKHSGIVFVISDFIASGYELPLKRLARRHDVVTVWISDEREQVLPDVGTLVMSDPETGQQLLVDTGSYSFKEWFGAYKQARETKTQDALKAGRIDQLRITTQEDYGEAVVKFFRRRRHR